MGIEKILAIVRRYAEAIAKGRIRAKNVKNMSDAELAAFDDELFAEFDAKQKEAERLAGDTEPVPNK